MAESVLIILINVSWQLTLIFAVSWLILKIFKIRLASARRVIWLWVVFSPLVLVPLNIVSSDLVIIHLGNFGRGEVINSDSSALIREVDKDSEPVSTIDPAENQILGEQPVLYREPRSRLYEQLSKEISAKLVMPLFIIWSIGTGMGFILLIAGYLRLKKLLIKAHQIRDEKAIAILRKTVIEVGTSRPIRLFTSNKARVPISIGFIHPCVVLPHWMLNSHEKLRMVLIHEISHLKRFDDFINLISRTIGSLFFFHPPRFPASQGKFLLLVSPNEYLYSALRTILERRQTSAPKELCQLKIRSGSGGDNNDIFLQQKPLFRLSCPAREAF